MPASTDMQCAIDKAHYIDKTLDAYDFQNRYVKVEHDDGSRFLFNYAFVRKDGHYLMVFTEHQGYHVFHEDEVTIEEMEVVNVWVPTQPESLDSSDKERTEEG
jgi:hypothetical protein